MEEILFQVQICKFVVVVVVVAVVDVDICRSGRFLTVCECVSGGHPIGPPGICI